MTSRPASVRFWQKGGRTLAVVPIMLGIGLAGTASAMLTTAVSLWLSAPGIDRNLVQAVLTAYPIGFLLGCLVARPLADRLGHERSFVIILLIATVAAAGFAVTAYLPAWFCLRLLGGLAMAALFVVCESWTNLYAERHNRGRLFAIYMFTTAIAVLAGQLLLALVGPQSPHLFAICAATSALSLVAKFATGPWPALSETPQQLPAAAAVAQERFGLLALFRLAPVTVVSIFQAGITNLNVFVLTPIYGARIGLSPAANVGLVTTLGVAGMVAQLPIGWLSDRFDRRVMLLAQGLLSVALCAAIVFAGDRSEPLLFVLFFAYGATALTVYPVAIAFANAQLPSRHMVAASGSLLLLYSIGNILTPGLSARLMDSIGAHAMLIVLGSGGILVAIAAVVNLLRPAAIPAAGAEAGP